MHDTNLLEDQPIAWTPTPDVIERAQLTKFMPQVGVSTWDELYEFSIRDVEKFTEEVLKFLDIKFDPPYSKLLNISEGIEFPNWFVRSAEDASSSSLIPHLSSLPTAGLNITEMCLDRWQTDEMQNKLALIVENEAEEVAAFTFLDLWRNVRYTADGLLKLGLQKGDAVGVHLPMISETVIALLAINRIGAIAVPVFSGYGVDAIASRMNAVAAKALVTCDGYFRRGKFFNAVEIAQAVVNGCPSIANVIAVENSTEGVWASFAYGLTRKVNVVDFDSLPVDSTTETRTDFEKTSAEDPLIILYTSGTTGKPKGIAHTHASFPIKAAQDMAFGTDVGKGTRISWYTDIGWMMGPWLIYGALINGATICIYDGAPDYPTPDRMWEFCAKHKVEVLGISPTLVRALAASEDNSGSPPYKGGVADASADGVVLPPSIESTPVEPKAKNHPVAAAATPLLRKEGSRKAPFERHDLSSLRIFASTGEPWNPAPWWWLFNEVGHGKLPIINYSGGTEISGGILMGNPLLPIKPCSFPAPCPGMDVDILDENGEPVIPGEVGELVIKQPWIGMARGFWQEKERYLDTYWRRFKDIWVHGDFAMRDKDGHWFILGRSDDTLKVAGKRVGPAEVESLLVAHPLVTEAAVIGVPDETKGTAMVAFAVLKDEGGGMRDESENSDSSLIPHPSALLEAELKTLVARDMGKPLTPSKIHFVSALPKTRNAKVMRRVIRSAYLGEDPGDLSALEDPKAVEEIQRVAT